MFSLSFTSLSLTESFLIHSPHLLTIYLFPISSGYRSSLAPLLHQKFPILQVTNYFKKWKLRGAKNTLGYGLFRYSGMCKKKYISAELKFATCLVCSKKLKDRRKTEVGMEFESYWMKHKKLSALADHEIHFATTFLPWSRRIHITEGFHEFL